MRKERETTITITLSADEADTLRILLEGCIVEPQLRDPYMYEISTARQLVELLK